MSVRKAIAAPRFAPTPLSWSLHMAFAALAAAAMVGPVRANPVGGVVVGGQASIAQPSPALTQINQSSQRAVIDWRSFSIGVGEAVRFNQPSASAATLNRVVGNDPSSILGSLSANGRVYLVNQNGVFIGRDAQVDAAALVLSTANVSNSDFMAGRLNFNQPGKPGARIVNEGRITAADGGLVAMVAPGVENRGVISAKLGQVILAGAPAFSLDLFGDGLVNIVLNQAAMGQIADATGKPLANYVDSSGRVVAEGGRIWISAATARGLVDGMVNISGELRATRVAQQGGEITLLGGDKLNVTGQVIAASADGNGGRIAASADGIVLASNAVLDANGATGGGMVHVGGSYQGKSPVAGAAATARTLQVDAGVRIAADASGPVGKGGQVVLWSEDDTRFAGSVSARAGAAGGDGGMMEVSGKKHLAFEGSANAAAPRGTAGTLLLDPGSLTVAASGAGGFTASGADSTVAAGTINQVLRSGTSVALRADDNITVNAQIDGRAPAGGTASPGGGLSLAAGGAVNVNRPIVLNDGAFNSTSGSFTQANGNVIATLGGKPISVSASGTIATQFLLTAGDLGLSSATGNISAGRALGGKLADGTLQPVANLSVMAPNGKVDLAPGIATTGNASLGARNVQLGEAIVGATLKVAAGSDLTLSDDVRVGAFAAGSATAPIAAFSMAGAGGKAPQLEAGKGGVSISATTIGPLGTIRSAGGIALDASQGAVVLGDLESTGAGLINVAAGGDISLPLDRSINSFGGSVAVRSRAGSIQAVGTIASNNAKAPAAHAAGAIDLAAAGQIDVNQLVALGEVTLTSAKGNVNLNQSLGGAHESAPLVGVLDIKAGGNVTTNGLNLAGAPGNRGLWIEAGAAGAGGKILVNERIGVSSGDLRFGSTDVNPDKAYSAVLYQGVYARNGNQNITFNVPVLADGSKIAAQWTRPGATLAELVDMILIPVFPLSSAPNTSAENLVRVHKGGLRVRFNESEGRITSIMSPDLPIEDGGFWMIPKVVISNQENPKAGDRGVITLAGGVSSTTVSNSKTAAIKLIVPPSNEERGIRAPNPDSDASALRREFTIDVSRHQLTGNSPANLVLGKSTHPTGVEYTQQGDGNFVNAALLVNDYTANGRTPANDDPTKPVPISVILYEGTVGTGRNSDLGGPLPGREFGFHSASTPVGFVSPVTNGGNNVDLFAQILGALPPTATNGIADNSELVAAVSAVKDRVGATQDVLCPGRQRQVFGRSAGDEADVGVVSALRGAPRSVFLTTYALGEVSEQLTTADSSRIAGVARADPCR